MSLTKTLYFALDRNTRSYQNITVYTKKCDEDNDEDSDEDTPYGAHSFTFKNIQNNEMVIEKPTKEKKTMYKFSAMGKMYDSNIVTRNYVEFIKDISNIHPYEMFKNSVVKCYISNTDVGMKQSNKINDNFYITGYSCTDRKIKQIEELCEFLDINLKRII